MKKEKSNAGRPKKELDMSAKQRNVMVPGYVNDNDSFKEHVRFQSFSQYVLMLIRKDLGI